MRDCETPRSSDWGAAAKAVGALPVPIKVQGITVRPGDFVILVTNGKRTPRLYLGVRPDGGVMLDQKMLSAIEYSCGPWEISDLLHPSILDGIIREIDADE